MEEKVLTIAREKARKEAHNPDTYQIDVVEEPRIWKVIFSPKVEGTKRIRGGGFEIQIGKDSLQVEKIIYYQ